MSLKHLTATAAAMGLLSIVSPALAQDASSGGNGAAQTENAQTPAQDQTPRGRVFEPAYFDQFVPRNALDMVDRLPGFSISGGGGGGGRGLGQANQNVLVNGERLSSKSDSVRDQLERIPAGDVVRIEIVDGTSLDLPGLTGQVANVIVDLAGISGTFSWKARLRDTAVDPEWYGGEISVAGTTGDLTFTVALANENNRFGAEGPTLITDAAGALIQTEDTVFTGAFDNPTLSANLGYDFGNDITATLNLSYGRTYFDRRENESLSGPLIDPNLRVIRTAEDGIEYEISGDLTIPIGAGQLKLIGVETFEEEDFSQQVTATFDDPQISVDGSRFTQLDKSGERIGRAEYNFPLMGAEWQASGEAAFNRLDRVSGLFELGAGGAVNVIDFPEGTGGVSEDRYETALSVSKQLTGRLSLQATGAYEFSTLKQTGSAANNRSFARPKGSVSLAWSNGAGFDIVLAAERRVGQLSFGDFLSRVFLDDENANAGNNELVPAQTWETSLEINKTLGPWGSTTLMLEQRWIEDVIDQIPLAGGGEGRGNIPNARRTEIEWTTTLLLGQIGIQGGQLDVRLEYEEGEIRDALTGDLRDFSGGVDREVEIDYRHDIPGSNFAYGASLEYERDRREFRLEEVSRGFAGPTFANLFIEHKDIAGLTVRGTVGNLLGARVRLDRTVFDGPRNTAPIVFIEDRNRRIGPIFRLDVSGNF
ncbi:TonB-dependent receptor plug domain-containing protein [Qipengyuania sp. DGS5-3]|uniref:TonB-dependent receptor plug domain-containing protein n=1 Tax=Qipengyuania sp. DGS5-3 TaxID=3349632 RepID=UPI0036D21C04